MGKKKGQTERTRVSAHEDRLKLNGVAWAAKLGIPTDEEFWAKWATLDDATVMVEPPVKDGSRCAYGCKRKVYFLESNARTHSQNCDGVCDRRAQKIIANFGFSREHNTGTTDGVLKRACGPRAPSGPSSTTATASSTPTTRRSAATSSSSGPRSGDGTPTAKRRSASASPSIWASGRGGSWPRTSRKSREQAELERVLALSMQGLAVHPELADSREDDELARALALSREQAAPPVSPVREDDDDDLAWALELSRASEPGSFDAGGADVWERVVDAQSGAPYWWNRDTDETTWDDPAAGRDGGGLSAALDGSAAAPFDTLEGMLRAVGLSDLAPALAAEEVDLETLKFLCLDDLVSDLGIPEAQAAALLAARDARERGLAGLA